MKALHKHLKRFLYGRTTEVLWRLDLMGQFYLNDVARVRQLYPSRRKHDQSELCWNFMEAHVKPILGKRAHAEQMTGTDFKNVDRKGCN